MCRIDCGGRGNHRDGEEGCDVAWSTDAPQVTYFALLWIPFKEEDSSWLNGYNVRVTLYVLIYVFLVLSTRFVQWRHRQLRQKYVLRAALGARHPHCPSSLPAPTSILLQLPLPLTIPPLPLPPPCLSSALAPPPSPASLWLPGIN